MCWRNRGVADLVYTVTIRVQFIPRDSSCSTSLESRCRMFQLVCVGSGTFGDFVGDSGTYSDIVVNN